MQYLWNSNKTIFFYTTITKEFKFYVSIHYDTKQ